MMTVNGHKFGAKLCMTLLVVNVLLITGCGGSSSSSSSSSHTAGAAAAESSFNKPATNTAGQAPHDPVTDGVVKHRPLHGTGGKEINDDNPGRADSGNQSTAGQSNPCALVSRAQAQAIMRGPIEAPQEAPLGPTCIYQATGTKDFITLSIQPRSFATVSPAIRHRTRFTLAGRSAYCGVYGQPTTFVPLNNGRVLDVTGPCRLGRLFAAKAIAELKT